MTSWQNAICQTPVVFGGNGVKWFSDETEVNKIASNILGSWASYMHENHGVTFEEWARLLMGLSLKLKVGDGRQSDPLFWRKVISIYVESQISRSSLPPTVHSFLDELDSMVTEVRRDGSKLTFLVKSEFLSYTKAPSTEKNVEDRQIDFNLLLHLYQSEGKYREYDVSIEEV